MEPTSKLTLSPEERLLVSDAGWILTKQAIIGKVYGIFGLLAERYRAIAADARVPEEVLRCSPKIAKGEQYRQLPYVMLDYPRCFEGADVFAIRTLFWWGNFFSITLQLSGTYKEICQPWISRAFEALKEEAWYLCIHPDPWEHHFGADNYCPLEQLTQKEFEKKIREGSFIKLAQQIPLSEWDRMPGLLEDRFKAILAWFDQLPSR